MDEDEPLPAPVATPVAQASVSSRKMKERAIAPLSIPSRKRSAASLQTGESSSGPSKSARTSLNLPRRVIPSRSDRSSQRESDSASVPSLSPLVLARPIAGASPLTTDTLLHRLDSLEEFVRRNTAETIQRVNENRIESLQRLGEIRRIYEGLVGEKGT